MATEALNKFKEFIKNISKQRVKMAKSLIDEYHKKSEDAVKKETNEFTIAANKGERLIDIDTKFTESPGTPENKDAMEVDRQANGFAKEIQMAKEN